MSKEEPKLNADLKADEEMHKLNQEVRKDQKEERESMEELKKFNQDMAKELEPEKKEVLKEIGKLRALDAKIVSAIANLSNLINWEDENDKRLVSEDMTLIGAIEFLKQRREAAKEKLEQKEDERRSMHYP